MNEAVKVRHPPIIHSERDSVFLAFIIYYITSKGSFNNVCSAFIHETRLNEKLSLFNKGPLEKFAEFLDFRFGKSDLFFFEVIYNGFKIGYNLLHFIFSCA